LNPPDAGLRLAYLRFSNFYWSLANGNPVDQTRNLALFYQNLARSKPGPLQLGKALGPDKNHSEQNARMAFLSLENATHNSHPVYPLVQQGPFPAAVSLSYAIRCAIRVKPKVSIPATKPDIFMPLELKYV
jgi:hypothetical protein